MRNLADAFLSYSSLHGWVESGRGHGFGELMRSVWRTRAFGDFWSYMMVAEGVVDVACEPELSLHDMAALDAIVTEAGGKFTGLDGKDGPWSGHRQLEDTSPNCPLKNGDIGEQPTVSLRNVENAVTELALRRQSLVSDVSPLISNESVQGRHDTWDIAM